MDDNAKNTAASSQSEVHEDAKPCKILLDGRTEASEFIDGPDVGLPKGWWGEGVKRVNGKNADKIDRYFYEMGKNKMFRSIKSAKEHAMQSQNQQPPRRPPPPAAYQGNMPPPPQSAADYQGKVPPQPQPTASYPGNMPPSAGYPGNMPHSAGYQGYMPHPPQPAAGYQGNMPHPSQPAAGY